MENLPEMIEKCRVNLTAVLARNADTLPPHTFDEIAALGSQSLNAALDMGLVEPETHAAEFVGALSPEARLHVFFQIVGPWLDLEGDCPSKEGKAALLELTEVMGADYAQALYRFAVLYTKLV